MNLCSSRTQVNHYLLNLPIIQIRKTFSCYKYSYFRHYRRIQNSNSDLLHFLISRNFHNKALKITAYFRPLFSIRSSAVFLSVRVSQSISWGSNGKSPQYSVVIISLLPLGDNKHSRRFRWFSYHFFQ